MRLKFRPTRLDDLSPCFAIIRDKFVYDSEMQVKLLRLWRELLTRRCATSAVIEDHERRGEHRLVGFGMSAFVTDEFARAAKRGVLPYITRRALEGWSGGASPFLTLGDIQRANSGEGLNCLVMHYGLAKHVWDTDDAVFVWNCLMEAFIHQHRGYQLKEIIDEVYGESDLRGLLTLGAKLVTDYGTSLKKASPPPPPDRRPYLIGVTREGVRTQDVVTYSTPLFAYTPPRFHLTLAEQDLLEHALEGATDENLASELKISLTAVKKRWSTIYQRVDAVDPDLVSGPFDTVSEGKRGAEKRRGLLAYLRDHPEELRPAAPPKASMASRATSRAVAARASHSPPPGSSESGWRDRNEAYISAPGRRSRPTD